MVLLRRARYGEYLLLDGRPEAEDYLPALLEGASARVSAYSDLANYYREEGAYDDALADYRHVLELQPGKPKPASLQMRLRKPPRGR